MVSYRQKRISELLREELSILITSELEDPRLLDAMASVTDVRVAPDLASSRVYVEHSGSPESGRAVIEALRQSESYLRRRLLENLDLRVIPSLSFHLDTAGERGRRVDLLLDEIARASGSTAEQDARPAADQ